MWRSTRALFDGTGSRSGRRHITSLATQEMLCGRPHNIAMEAMRQEGITEALTHDNHFTQEGFTILL